MINADIEKAYPGVKIDTNLPLVNVGNSKFPSYLPLEVCIVLPGQSSKRKLSPDQTSDMIKFACRRPKENAMSITNDARDVLGFTAGNLMLVSQFSDSPLKIAIS
jgi:eukaryotic translation initiation factor 2C